MSHVALALCECMLMLEGLGPTAMITVALRKQRLKVTFLWEHLRIETLVRPVLDICCSPVPWLKRHLSSSSAGPQPSSRPPNTGGSLRMVVVSVSTVSRFSAFSASAALPFCYRFATVLKVSVLLFWDRGRFENITLRFRGARQGGSRLAKERAKRADGSPQRVRAAAPHHGDPVLGGVPRLEGPSGVAAGRRAPGLARDDDGPPAGPAAGGGGANRRRRRLARALAFQQLAGRRPGAQGPLWTYLNSEPSRTRPI